MKAIQCQLCGSNELTKVGDFFVCDHCSTKYSIEEARKLMIEGTVDVSGSTVKVDQSAELKNLYELARRAKKDNNSENAQKYYDQLLIKDPSSWEANFYVVYYQTMNCRVAEIQSAAIRLSNCEDTVLQLIKDNISEPNEQKKAVDEIAARLITIARMLYNAAMNFYNDIEASIKADYTQEMLHNCCATRDICYNFGNYVIEFFGDSYGNDIAVPCWEVGIEMHNGVMAFFAQKETNKNIIIDYSKKIQKYDSSFQVPTVYIPSSACYVATAVYGSYDCPQVWTLRRYRDYTLAATWCGKAFIKIYYAISPTLVKWFGHTHWVKKLWQNKLDKMVARLQQKGTSNTPYQDRL